MGIYSKLLEIQKRVKGLGKDSKSFGYQYVSGAKVLSEIKPIMNELGVILKQEVLSVHNERQDYSTKNGDKSEILTSASMKFTWVDVETGEKDENLFHANGQNDWEKGLGSALTYAERYFILKYFHIPTDEDDIDNPERKPESEEKPTPIKKVDDSKSPQKKATPSKQQEASDSEEAQRKSKALIAIKSLFNGAKFTDDEVLKYIIKVYKKPSLEDLVKQSTLDQLTGIYETLKTKSDSGELNKV